ncbi:MAG: ATP-binding protein [Bacteroidetes bacterium]|nr:MAG: ATP-binding protein [Bacteroidota bacterium]
MNKNERIILNSNLAEQNKLVGFIENICDQHNIYTSYYANIVTSISEAFNNAVIHGNGNDDEKKVVVDFVIQNDGFSFCITDQGDGFDFSSIADPTDINNPVEETGRGIFLMDILSDNLEFKNNGRTACMKFLIANINKEAADKRVDKLKAYMNSEVKQALLN